MNRVSTMKSIPAVRETIKFGSDLRRYFGIILTMLQREMALRRVNPAESLLDIAEPLILIGTIMTLRILIEGHKSTSPLGGSGLMFYVTGLYPKYLFIYISIKRVGGAVGSPRHRFPVEQRLDLFLVHVLLRTFDFAILGIVVFGAIYFFVTPDALPYTYLPVFWALGTAIMFGFGWGMLNIVFYRLFWIWPYVSMGLNRALIICSGALFVPDFMPPNIRDLLSYYPEMHAICLFRTGFYPHYPAILLDTTYMTYSAFTFVILGLVLERVTRRIEERR